MRGGGGCHELGVAHKRTIDALPQCMGAIKALNSQSGTSAHQAVFQSKLLRTKHFVDKLGGHLNSLIHGRPRERGRHLACEEECLHSRCCLVRAEDAKSLPHILALQALEVRQKRDGWSQLP